MGFPIFRIHGDEGEHIDGGLEHIEFSVSAKVMKTISGIAALHILPEGLSKTVGTAFVSVAWNALFIRPNKDAVVIFAVLKERLCLRKISLGLTWTVWVFFAGSMLYPGMVAVSVTTRVPTTPSIWIFPSLSVK